MINQLKQGTLIIVLLLLLPLCIFAQNKNKPNILWLTSEDNSADWLGCYQLIAYRLLNITIRG